MSRRGDANCRRNPAHTRGMRPVPSSASSMVDSQLFQAVKDSAQEFQSDLRLNCPGGSGREQDAANPLWQR